MKLDDRAARGLSSIFDPLATRLPVLLDLAGVSVVVPAAARTAVLAGQLHVDFVLVKITSPDSKHHSLQLENLLCTETHEGHVPVHWHGDPSEGHVASDPVALWIPWVSGMRCKLVGNAGGDVTYGILVEVIAELKATIAHYDVSTSDRRLLLRIHQDFKHRGVGLTYSVDEEQTQRDQALWEAIRRRVCNRMRQNSPVSASLAT